MVAYSYYGQLETASRPLVGGEIVTLPACQILLRKPIPLGHTLTIFDAEATSALMALESTIMLPPDWIAYNIGVFLDNLDVARRLLPLPG